MRRNLYLNKAPANRSFSSIEQLYQSQNHRRSKAFATPTSYQIAKLHQAKNAEK